MVRQKSVQPLAATLALEKAIPLLEKQISDAQFLRSEKNASLARQEWINTSEGLLIAALGSSHRAVQTFSGAQCGAYGPWDTEESLRAQANTQLDGMLAVLRSVVQQLRWNLPDDTQVFLPAGSVHDAYVEIRGIVQQVTAEVFIVDSWVDHTLWQLLKNVPPGTKIRIMTTNMKGDFALEGKAFAAQHGSTVELRQTTQYHDRFILVDGKRCWHLGASIKDAGKKAFVMSEIASPAIRSAITFDVEVTWNAAAVIPV